MQVSPAEIEMTLLNHPGGLVDDVAVAGVQVASHRGKDTLSERVPRAWVVLTEKGRAVGEEHARRELKNWIKTNLSKYKQLKGGIEFVHEVCGSPECLIDQLTVAVDPKDGNRQSTSTTADRALLQGT